MSTIQFMASIYILKKKTMGKAVVSPRKKEKKGPSDPPSSSSFVCLYVCLFSAFVTESWQVEGVLVQERHVISRDVPEEAPPPELVSYENRLLSVYLELFDEPVHALAAHKADLVVSLVKLHPGTRKQLGHEPCCET